MKGLGIQVSKSEDRNGRDRRRKIFVAPAVGTVAGPFVVVGRAAVLVYERVDGRGPAEDLAPGIVELTSIERGLWSVLG